MEQSLSTTLCSDTNPMTLRFEGNDGFVVSVFCRDSYKWLLAIAEDLRHIQALEDGWDFGSGRATKSDCVQTAFTVLNEIMRPNSIEPRISPLPTGGLQMEWQAQSKLLQIEIDPTLNINAYYRDGDKEEEFQFSLTDESRIGPIADQLQMAA